MKTLRKIELSEISGAWIVTKDETPVAYSQLPATKDYVRLVKDLVKLLDLHMLIDIREK